MIKKDLSIYFRKQLFSEADQDLYSYPNLVGTDFENDEQRAAYFYQQYPPEGYYVDFPNPAYIMIMMRVDPCRVNGINDLCCDGSNEAVCEDNTIINSGTDIGVAWFINGFVLHCDEKYQEKGVCGTFIEIHRPNDPTVVDELKISKKYSSGFSTEFISTKNLCAGRYEFWYVVRSRNGSTLQFVKPFFSIYPSCGRPPGFIDDLIVEEEEIEEEEVIEVIIEEVEEEEPYYCDKSKNRTTECQEWVTPEEQAAIDAYIAAKIAYYES